MSIYNNGQKVMGDTAVVPITQTINASSTEKEIPSAKAVYDNCIIGKPITQETIDTYGDEILKYPLGVWKINGNNIAAKFKDLPVAASGRIEITSIDNNDKKNPWESTWSYRVYHFETHNSENYFRKISNGSVAGVIVYDSKWKRVVNTTVANVPKTAITFSDETNYSVVSNSCQYIVKDGICTIMLYVKCITPVDTWLTVANVPKANINHYQFLISNDGNKFLKCVVTSGGVLQLVKGESANSYIGTFSYPVAES